MRSTSSPAICAASCCSRRCTSAASWPSTPAFAPAATLPPVGSPDAAVPAPPEAAPAPAETAPLPPPEPPAPDRKTESRAKVAELIRKHGVQVIALGNGTGCRETEEIIAELIAQD